MFTCKFANSLLLLIAALAMLALTIDPASAQLGGGSRSGGSRGGGAGIRAGSASTAHIAPTHVQQGMLMRLPQQSMGITSAAATVTAPKSGDPPPAISKGAA